jgi:hypothetical protein
MAKTYNVDISTIETNFVAIASQNASQINFILENMMKKIRILVLGLLLVGIAPFFSWAPAHAEEMTCPIHTLVNIDIRPGNAKNQIKLSSKGVIAVAVLSTVEFDASQFAPQMAHLADAEAAMNEGCSGATAVRWSLDDENGDGQPDLVFFFRTQDLPFTVDSTSATFMAHGTYGATEIHIMGMDAVKVVP